jgi:cyclopropane fatty-acyl-phospholipid synthase-like methyltransferase
MVNMGYWTRGAMTDRAAQEQLVHELASRVPSLKGLRVLDAGCGLTGPAAILAYDDGAQIDGINIVEQQLRWARQYIEANGLDDTVRVYVASAMDMPFLDESFDVVFCLEAADCFIDKPRFLEEAHRVLRLGGTLLLADITATTHLPLVKWQPALRLNLVTAADWQRMIEAAGFTVDEKEMIGRAVYPGCLRWSAHIAADRRRAIFNKSCKTGTSLPVRRLKMMQAWVLELILFQSFLPLMI